MSCWRGGGRRGALAAVVGLLAIAGLVGSPAATAAATGTGAAGGRQPFGENAETIRFDVERITPDVVAAAGPTSLTISGRMTNTGDVPLTDLDYRFQRGDALADSVSLAAELADPSQPSAAVEPTFQSMGTDLTPGQAARFAVSVPITEAADGSGLGVTEPGVYPLMLNVNATLPESSGIGRARAGELHVLLTVTAVPGTDPTAGSAPTMTAAPVVTFAPIADTVHVGVGGVFLNDDLATDIRTGGRLATLVDQLTALPYPEVVDLLVDPMLLEELSMMAAGYRVVADVGTPQPALTPPEPQPVQPTDGAPSGSPNPDSAGAESSAGTAQAAGTTASPAPTPAILPAGSVPGTGGPDAAAFLDRLRTLAARHRVVVLPYGNPDAVALTRADLQVSLRTSVKRGVEVAEQVLGSAAGSTAVPLETTVAVPPAGAVDGATAAVLAEAGFESLVLAGRSVSSPAPVGTGVVALPDDAGGGSLPALVGDSPVLSTMHRVVQPERGDSTAVALNVLAAELVQQSLDGDPVPISYLPTGDAASFTQSDPAAGRQLNALFGRLADAGAIRAGDPAVLAAGATAPVMLDYTAARADELPASYLTDWKDSSAAVSGVSASLAATAQGAADPDRLIDELRDAMRPLGSASLRTDQQPGELILAGVDDTLDGIRAGVSIRSTAGSYTLASGSAPLVLTVRNDLPYDATVRVVLEGAARSGLTVEDPGVIVVPAQRSQQVPLPVTVNRSGTFSVEAVLIGADGAAWGEPVELRIRSTAYGAITVIVIVVAGAALLLMVVLRIVQRVRHRGRGTGDEPATDETDGTGHHPAPDSITAAANHPPPDDQLFADPAGPADPDLDPADPVPADIDPVVPQPAVDPVGTPGAGRT